MESPNNLINSDERSTEELSMLNAKLYVELLPSCSVKKVIKSKEDFSHELSVNGGGYMSVELCYGSNSILEEIRNRCKNVKSMSLYGFGSSPQIEGFRNLKELKINSCPISITELRNCFASNPDIESLKYDGANENFMVLLELLPKLKRLALMWRSDPIDPHQIQHLLHLKNLTKLSCWCTNSDNFVMEVAQLRGLVELELTMNISDDTFDIIKSFDNLEILSIRNSGECHYKIVEPTAFPVNLKCMKLLQISMDSSMFLSIVEGLTFLEEVHLCRVIIFWDQRPVSGGYPHSLSETISRIAEQLRLTLNQRTLKIIDADLRCNVEYTIRNNYILKEWRRGMDRLQSKRKNQLSVFHHFHHHDGDEDCSSSSD